ncbi:MAG: CBS domain-containing protein, partial [Gemmatimonadales bacterium]
MSWILLLTGLVVAFVASAGAASLVASAQVELAEAIARRLRGAEESLAWVSVTQRQVVAATAGGSFGVALVGAALPGVFSELSVSLVTLLVFLIGVPLALVAGYVLPRWLTAPRAERVVNRLRPVIAGWTTLLGIVLQARAGDADDEVRALAREGAATGLGTDELVMVGGVMSFTGRPVREVMTPRTDVVAVPQSAGYDEIEAVFAESGYTRIPVHGATLDEIVGMIHAFDLFKYRPGDALPLRPVSFAPEQRPVGDVLLDMQRERQHLAVVVDEFGGTAGIVTLEDLLESIVGEIADEDEEILTDPAQPPSAVLEVDGTDPSRVIAEHFD